MKCLDAGRGRFLSSSTCSIILLSAVFLFSACTFANAKDRFQLYEDGSVGFDGRHFRDMEEYVHSEHFREAGRRCGAESSGLAVDRPMARAMSDCTMALTKIKDEYWLCDIVYTVPVWFHVIHKADGTGNISNSAINAQINVLNEDFRAMAGTKGSQGLDVRIQFILAGITRTQNDAWFSDSDNSAYTQVLNKNPSRNINIYSNCASGYLGYATFPQQAAGIPSDGIVVNYASVGGRDNGFGMYDQGRTLVHEMGHYLGLFHTFSGYACSNSYSRGDLVVDTPAENVEHYECVQHNTCGTGDPITNYMNYTPDSCMNEFTREQASRAICSMVNYRPALFQEVMEEGGTCLDGDILPTALIPLLLRK